jgi:RNA polymerase sigma-70 factor, ECF subfamily
LTSRLVAEHLSVDVSEERVSGIVEGPAERDARVRQIVSSYYDFIWRSLRRLGLDATDAEDAAQEVFSIAASKLDQIVEGKERAFLFGTALRVASTERRTAARRRAHLASELSEPSDPAPGADEKLDRRRARALLDEALEELDLELRSVFVLFELEELSAPEISDLLEIPAGTVASRLRRARLAFRSAVQRLRLRQGWL